MFSTSGRRVMFYQVFEGWDKSEAENSVPVLCPRVFFFNSNAHPRENVCTAGYQGGYLQMTFKIICELTLDLFAELCMIGSLKTRGTCSCHIHRRETGFSANLMVVTFFRFA